MKSPRFLVAVLACLFSAILLLWPSSALAQSEFETTIKQFTGDEAKGYMQPGADLFGADMMAGQYRSAAIPTMGFNISLDIVAMAAIVGDNQKTFTNKAPAGFSPGAYSTATIFGKTGATVVNTNYPSLSYRSADGIFNTSAVPLAVPQLRVGSIYGTEAFIRFVSIPNSVTKSFPDITLFGGGIRHNISQYLPAVPLDLAAGVFYTTFKTGDLVDFKGFSFGVQASKDFAILTVYGGLAYESCTLKLHYTSENAFFNGQSVDVSLDGQNKFRATAGANVSLAFFHIFADINVGTVTNFSGGIGFGF
jgi:hypothetical protein